MATERYFHPMSKSYPVIYAYEQKSAIGGKENYIYVGYTVYDVHEHFINTYKGNHSDFRNILVMGAMNASGSVLTDDQIKNHLFRMGYASRLDGCIRVSKDVLLSIIKSLMEGNVKKERTETFDLRPEQREAIDMTKEYFIHMDSQDPDRAPHFLWNCKMRFGKTFASYMLAKEMNWKRILILTFKPAVESAWEEDLNTHVAFDGWNFISCRATTKSPKFPKEQPLVCFGSFQDLMGKSQSGGIKIKNEWFHCTNSFETCISAIKELSNTRTLFVSTYISKFSSATYLFI